MRKHERMEQRIKPSRSISRRLEQVQLRVYEIYFQRGRQDGLDLEDWFQAEKELRTSGHNRSRVIGQVERLRARRGKHGNRNR